VRFVQDRAKAVLRITKKRTHTVVPVGRNGLPDWTAAGFDADVG
jgi:hypothetical protein